MQASTPANTAAPASFDAHTALVVVDVQNDFADPKGSLYVAGGEQVVPVIDALIARARAAGAFVVYTQDWHPEQTPHFVDAGGKWPRHCVRGTWGAQLMPDLTLAGPVVQKGTGGEDGYSGFSQRDPRGGSEQPTALARMLRERAIERAVIVGIALDVCVKETALDARRLGFDTSVIAGATRPVDAADADRAVAQMRSAGVTIQ